MVPSRSAPLLAALLVTLTALWVAMPTGATHGASYEGSIPSTASNHVYQNLTIKSVTGGGNLTSATVNQWFTVNASQGLHITKSNVGTSLSLRGVSGSDYAESIVTGTTYINGSSNLNLSKMTFKGDVRIVGSNHVRFNQSVFQKCVTKDSASTEVSWGTTNAPPTCPTSSPTTTSRSVSPSPTTVTDCYANGQFVACPTKTSTSPTPTKPAPDSYVYELVGGTSRDVYVRGADRVTIRDSTIFGSVYIAESANVVLENADIHGDLRIDQSLGVAVIGPHVGGLLALSGVSEFKVLGSPSGEPGTIGGLLGCYKCANGLLQNLQAGGPVEIQDSMNVQRLNVVGETPVDYVPPPAPTPGPGDVTLNVTDEGLTFTHDTDVQGTTTGVRLEMSLFEARARLELASPAQEPGPPRLELESRFEKIVEFEDRNGDGGYDLSDLVLREYLVDDLNVSVQQERLGDGEEGWRGRLDYALPPGGTFSLIFTARDTDPDNTKIDVAFHNYPYASGTSQLALQVRLASASDWEIVRNAEEDRLLFHGRGVDGFFGWLHAVRADDEEHDVTARVLEEHKSASGEREVVLYLAYPHASDILHDPSIGLSEAFSLPVSELGNLLVYGTTLVAVLAVLWALGQSGRRRAS
jgi:hypothetical protein